MTLRVIVDTSVWLQFLKAGIPSVRTEMNLLRARGEIVMVGVVLAELLQGVRNQKELEQLADWFSPLPYLAETRDTWTRVGRLSYELRRRGAAVSLSDLVIAVLALEHDASIFTLDEHFQRIPGLKLHKAVSGGQTKT